MLSTLAQKVQDDLTYEQKVFIDPATAMLIMTIVTQVIKAIKECRQTPEASIAVAHHPTAVERVMLRRKIRKNLGFFRFRREGQQYYDAVLNAGTKTTLQELTNAFDEC